VTNIAVIVENVIKVTRISLIRATLISPYIALVNMTKFTKTIDSNQICLFIIRLCNLISDFFIIVQEVQFFLILNFLSLMYTYLKNVIHILLKILFELLKLTWTVLIFIK